MGTFPGGFVVALHVANHKQSGYEEPSYNLYACNQCRCRNGLPRLNCGYFCARAVARSGKASKRVDSSNRNLGAMNGSWLISCQRIFPV